MVTLLIDNNDSFTWNVYQLLSVCGADVVVHRSDMITLEDCIKLSPRNVVISPGPGSPSEANVSLDVIKEFMGKIPILGVCLGHQCIVHLLGGKVAKAGEYMHGKVSEIIVDQMGIFRRCPRVIKCMRYHSLAGEVREMPKELVQTAHTAGGILMGVRHAKYKLEGIQFHPESVFSEHGKEMIEEFLSWEGGVWEGAQSPACSASILQTIYEKRKLDVAEAQKIPSKSYGTYERMIALGICPEVTGMYRCLRAPNHNTELAIIGEFKRRSPSIRNICLDADLLNVAAEYAQAGVSAISILTEPTWFAGDIQDMYQVRLALDSISERTVMRRPSLLRKDFIFCKYQLLEARVFGADSVLLIVSILSGEQLLMLLKFSRDLGMEPLVEVASSEELACALKAGALIIGINNRDLNTFKIDRKRFNDIRDSCGVPIPSEVILISLSGISTAEDVLYYKNMGACAVLVGQSLMQAKNKYEKIHELTNTRSIVGIPQQMSEAHSNRTLIKICGLRTAEEAVYASKAGADMIGLVYAKSKRKISAEAASEIRAEINGVSRYPAMAGEYEKWRSQVIFSRSSPLVYSNNADSELHPQSSPSLPESVLHWYESQIHSLKLASLNRPLLVGVFTDEETRKINEIVRTARLDIVQLHCEKDPDILPLINVPVIQLVSAKDRTMDMAYLEKVARKYAFRASLLLFDTPPPEGEKTGGGFGKTFNWLNLKNNLPEFFPRFALAGGLSPVNVKDSMGTLSPACVDVSSGVEKADCPVVKDRSLIGKFINAVKEFDSHPNPISENQNSQMS